MGWAFIQRGATNFTLEISVGIIGIGKAAGAQNYPRCAYYGVSAGQTAASQPFNNVGTS